MIIWTKNQRLPSDLYHKVTKTIKLNHKDKEKYYTTYFVGAEDEKQLSFFKNFPFFAFTICFRLSSVLHGNPSTWCINFSRHTKHDSCLLYSYSTIAIKLCKFSAVCLPILSMSVMEAVTKMDHHRIYYRL